MLLCRSSTVIDSKAMIIFHKHSQFLQNMNASLSLHNYFMFHRYRNVSIQRKHKKKSSFEMTIFHCDARNLSSPRLSTFVSLKNMSEYGPVRLRSLYVHVVLCNGHFFYDRHPYQAFWDPVAVIIIYDNVTCGLCRLRKDRSLNFSINFQVTNNQTLDNLNPDYDRLYC